jgi:DNA-directed RNA polymerase specialized sigma54-like protein
MEPVLLRSKVINAINHLIEKDKYLLEIDVHERTITHRLALYLQCEFEDWNVDCEYNRNWDVIKQIQIIKQLNVTFPQNDFNMDESVSVFPDIIIHHRKSSENLLVVEVKKTTSKVSSDYDFWKLNELRCQLRYDHQLFLRMDVGNGRAGVESMQWDDEIPKVEYKNVRRGDI